MKNYPNRTPILSILISGPESPRKRELLEALRQFLGPNEPIEGFTLGAPDQGWRTLDVPMSRLGVVGPEWRNGILRLHEVSLPAERLHLNLMLRGKDGVLFIAGATDEGPGGNAEGWRALAEVLKDPSQDGWEMPLALLPDVQKSEGNHFWKNEGAGTSSYSFTVLLADEPIHGAEVALIVDWLHGVAANLPPVSKGDVPRRQLQH